MNPVDPSAAANLALDRILSEIYLRLRQGKFAEAKERLAKAKALAPDAPAVLEIEGDLAFAQRNYRTAETLYRDALTRDRKNTKLEEKYARALLKVHEPEYAYLRNYDDSLWSNRVPRNPIASTLLSALLPGLGQLYNGDIFKGIIMIFFAILFESQVVWAYARVLVKSQQVPHVLSRAFDTLFHGANPVLLLIILGLWVYGLIDAWLVAKESR
jgi:tetratricopeptide (TPR) repeat protein